ncbi:unnamed protein product, partial [Parnassius apollo]
DILDELSASVQKLPQPWLLMYADDIALVDGDKGRLTRRVHAWREALENGGLKLNVAKTEYMACNSTDLTSLRIGDGRHRRAHGQLQEILTGAANICLVGGTELMSSLPLLVRNVRFGTSLGTAYKLEDHIKKQLVDTFCGHSMEKIAEQIAKKYKLSREAVDQYTLLSHIKWSSAQEAKVFDDEITPTFAKVDKKDAIVRDEKPRSNLLLEDLATLAPVMDDGSIITSGNSSAPADGAAALILANEESVNKFKVTPMARLTAWACVGVDPVEAGLGAVVAILKLLAVSNKKIKDVDLFEINETFASQAIAIVKELRIDPSKVNVNGGALSVGNPVAATGARMAAHLSHQIRRNNARIAVAASSCGGGQGVAILLESL